MALNLDVIGRKFGPVSRTYDWQDIALYALGVGAGYDELEYVYENRLKVLPSFAILSIYEFFTDFITASGVNLAGILHGEHELILRARGRWSSARLTPITRTAKSSIPTSPLSFPASTAVLAASPVPARPSISPTGSPISKRSCTPPPTSP